MEYELGDVIGEWRGNNIRGEIRDVVGESFVYSVGMDLFTLREDFNRCRDLWASAGFSAILWA